MRKYLFIPILLLSLSACNRNGKQPASDLRFCGRWMTLNPNHEYFSLKNDGTYTDLRFQRSPTSKAPKGVSWVLKNDMLYLTYEFSNSVSPIFKTLPQFTLQDTIKLITDSTLVLATPASKKYPSRWISLIKMKENGKYTTE